ncbi:hypothetical protein [Legionella micdadei]
MKQILEKLFPCKVTTFTHGIEAVNFLLAPSSAYDLVILDGRLRSLPHTLQSFAIDGPDIAESLKEKGIKARVVLWSNDPDMLQRFDEVYGRRLPEIEKPCRETNVQAVLAPIIQLMLSNETSPQDFNEAEDASRISSSLN